MYPISEAAAFQKSCPFRARRSDAPAGAFLCIGRNCAFWRFYELPAAQLVGQPPAEPRISVEPPPGVTAPALTGVCLLVPTTRTDLSLAFPQSPFPGGLR